MCASPNTGMTNCTDLEKTSCSSTEAVCNSRRALTTRTGAALQWGSREVGAGFVAQGAPGGFWVHHGRGEVKPSGSTSSLACCVEKQCLLVSEPLSPMVFGVQ